MGIRQFRVFAQYAFPCVVSIMAFMHVKSRMAYQSVMFYGQIKKTLNTMILDKRIIICVLIRIPLHIQYNQVISTCMVNGSTRSKYIKNIFF